MWPNGSGLGGVFAATVLSVLVASPVPTAGAGSLDTSFGSGGVVTTDLGGLGAAYGVAVQSDGKIVAAGYANHGGNYDFALVRYTAAGALDPSFGSAGTVLTDIGGSGKHDIGRSVAVQPDGKIIVAGQSSAGPGTAVARYDGDGHLDDGFASGGVLVTRIPGIAYAVAVQADGKIVVAGSAGSGTRNDIAVARFLSDGSADQGFGDAGTVLTDVRGAGGNDVAGGLALQPDGRILVAGGTDTGGGNAFVVLRYRPDGRLDPSFSGGVVVSHVGGAGRTGAAAAVVVRPDGSVVAAGASRTSGGACDFALAAYRSDGGPEEGFGTGGTVLTPVGGTGSHAYASALALAPSGRLIVVGSAGHLDRADHAVVRYGADGTPDPAFGDGGSITTDIHGTDDRAFAVALQPDGKIVTAGYAGVGLAVTRFLDR